MTEDEMVEWHHGLNRNKCEQTPGDGEGQGTLVCLSFPKSNQVNLVGADLRLTC